MRKFIINIPVNLSFSRKRSSCWIPLLFVYLVLMHTRLIAWICMIYINVCVFTGCEWSVPFTHFCIHKFAASWSFFFSSALLLNKVYMHACVCKRKERETWSAKEGAVVYGECELMTRRLETNNKQQRYLSLDTSLNLVRLLLFLCEFCVCVCVCGFWHLGPDWNSLWVPVSS